MTPDPGQTAVELYRRILEGVAARGGEMGRRPIASHWPHVGSRYLRGGLLYAGQALDGWDAPDAPARWRVADVSSPEGRERVLASTRAWHADLDEPIWGVLKYPKRTKSSFWSLGEELTDALSPGPAPWYSRIAWANVYPLGYDTHHELGIRSGPPVAALKEVQDPIVGPLFGALVEVLDPSRIVIVAGPDYWRGAERGLGLSLAPAPFPLIRAGRVNRRSWVVGYHPAYSRKAGKRFHGPGTGTNAYYLATVERVLRELEVATP